MSLTTAQITEIFTITDEDFREQVPAILNYNIRNEISQTSMIAAINKHISFAKTRYKSLEYLNLILDNCPSILIAENASNWINHCLVKHVGDKLKQIKVTVIGKIVENIHNNAEFTKKFVSDYISNVLDLCLSTPTNTYEAKACLKTLTLCMRFYGSWFAPHRARIENYLVVYLEQSSEDLVENASLAFHYFQQIGGSGLEGFNHKKNFSANFYKLCNTVHKLFDMFFENETEIDVHENSNEEHFKILNLPINSEKLMHVTAKRIRNCLIFLSTMLIKAFPVAKEIRIFHVISLIKRGTAIHHCLGNESDASLFKYQFMLALNKMQIRLLNFLKIFIIWSQTDCLPFFYDINKILIDCLSRCQNCVCFEVDSIYHEKVYKVLCSWLKIAGNYLHTHFQKQLVTCVLKDIIPTKNNVTISIPNESPKNISIKAKRKNIQDKIIASGQEKSYSESLTLKQKLNEEIKCVLALDTLKYLLKNANLNLPANILCDLFKLMNTILDVNTSKFEHPYGNYECQKNLYEILVACYEQENSTILPPLHFAIHILSNGVNSRDRRIAEICSDGLNSLEKLCQPICPVLQSPCMDSTSKLNLYEKDEDLDDSPEENCESSAENSWETKMKQKLAEHSASNRPKPLIKILDVQIIKKADNVKITKKRSNKNLPIGGKSYFSQEKPKVEELDKKMINVVEDDFKIVYTEEDLKANNLKNWLDDEASKCFDKNNDEFEHFKEQTQDDFDIYYDKCISEEPPLKRTKSGVPLDIKEDNEPENIAPEKIKLNESDNSDDIIVIDGEDDFLDEIKEDL